MTNTTITSKQGETFTFQPGMISSIKTNFEVGVDQLKMPVSGPMNNQGLDMDGTGKTITISGQFLDTNVNVLTNSSNNIRSQVMMKYWFESIPTGFQEAVRFTSYLDSYSAIGEGTTVFTDTVSNTAVTFYAEFVETYAYIIGLSYDDDEGDPEKTPFTLTLWVAGI